MENMLKLKEEFDYKSLARRLDIQLDKLIMEHERKQKAFEVEIERITAETQNRISEAERNYADAVEVRLFSCFAFVGLHMHLCRVEGKREVFYPQNSLLICRYSKFSWQVVSTLLICIML